MDLTKTGSDEKAGQPERPVARIIEGSFLLVLFLASFVPRAVSPLARSTIWHYRALEFVAAVSRRDWGATLLAPHPGITTMWLAGLANRVGQTFVENFDGLLLHRQMAFELLPLALVISLAIVAAYALLGRVFDRTVARVAALLLALDPFHIYISKTLHVDALVSVFAMASALAVLVYVGQGEHRIRYMILSGLLAGLALLSKTSALFLVPYLLLCLGVWRLRSRKDGAGPSMDLRGMWGMAGKVLAAVLPWTLALAAAYFALWPSMWVQPMETLRLSLSETLRYTGAPHPRPLLFLGETTLQDPGPLFYPAHLALKSTEVTLPLFFVGSALLFSRRLERRQRLALLLAVAFVVFFTVQMSLAHKKAARYNLPAYQFLDIVSAVGAVAVAQWLARGRRWLIAVALAVVVAAQLAIAVSYHPYHGTHYNRLFGSPEALLEEKKIVAGQEQGEGLDLAAAYLNDLPMSPLLVAGAQIDELFIQYFQGKGVPMTDDKVDYLIFARNWIVRGMDAHLWADLWAVYRTRQPKKIISFDGVPYVWIYKVGPVIDGATVDHPVDATVGENFWLLGYDLEPTRARPGEPVRLTLYWEAIGETEVDYTVFTHLLDPAGEQRGQKDSQPQGGMYPTFLWDEGERVADRYEITVAPDAPPGRYQIAVGMYYLPTLERLSIVDGNGVPLPDARLLIDGPEIVAPSQ
jgi:hypothetical protein